MIGGQRIPRVEGAKCLLFVPALLPLRLDQMKRILSATARHRGEILRKAASPSNGRFATSAYSASQFQGIKPLPIGQNRIRVVYGDRGHLGADIGDDPHAWRPEETNAYL